MHNIPHTKKAKKKIGLKSKNRNWAKGKNHWRWKGGIRKKQLLRAKKNKEKMQKIFQKKIEKEKLAYIAGFIDGEGSISISKQIRKRPTKHLGLIPFVTIANTDRKALNYIVKTLGFGYVRKIRQYKNKTQNKDCYGIVFNGGKERIIRLLELLLPYFITKEKQARLLLRWCKLRRRIDNVQKNSFKSLYSKEEIKIADRVRALNKRGK